MITGGPGSGKSTLAMRLGELTGLPIFHIDKIHWTEGWVERSREEKDQLTHEVHMKDAWIFEGAYSSTYAERIARADTFIWLDVPVLVRLWRVVWRSIRDFGQVRPDMADGCPERINLETLHFLAFIWRTRHSARAKLSSLYTDPPSHVTVVRLTSIAEVELWLKQLDIEGLNDKA